MSGETEPLLVKTKLIVLLAALVAVSPAAAAPGNDDAADARALGGKNANGRALLAAGAEVDPAGAAAADLTAPSPAAASTCSISTGSAQASRASSTCGCV